MFKDISNFNNIEDYLPILTAILIVDIIVMILSKSNIITSHYLRIWYKKFLLSAILADVLAIFLFAVIARAIYYYIFTTFTIINFIILMLIIQIIHDILFYIIFSLIPRGANGMINIFKDYADEMSYNAIIGDSLMVIAIGFLASYLANFNANTNIILLTIFVYLLQYFLYS